MFGRRILIAVPHADDEVVGCAAFIGHAQRDGAEIFALYLTHGCIAKETMWPWRRGQYDKIIRRRRHEADQAAQFLGITPVGWSMRPARHLWRDLKTVAAEIRAAIDQYAIDQLWVPAYEGGNADHDGLNAVSSIFNLSAGAAQPPSPRGRGWGRGPSTGAVQETMGHSFVLEFAEYNFSGGKAQSQTFPTPNGNEITITLTPFEQKKKRMALAIYTSEKRNLNYVDVKCECFRPLAQYDYARPPHPGTLWYARHQWVPFRHPRVDFTKADEVCAAIGAFLISG